MLSLRGKENALVGEGGLLKSFHCQNGSNLFFVFFRYTDTILIEREFPYVKYRINFFSQGSEIIEEK